MIPRTRYYVQALKVFLNVIAKNTKLMDKLNLDLYVLNGWETTLNIHLPNKCTGELCRLSTTPSFSSVGEKIIGQGSIGPGTCNYLWSIYFPEEKKRKKVFTPSTVWYEDLSARKRENKQENIFCATSFLFSLPRIWRWLISLRPFECEGPLWVVVCALINHAEKSSEYYRGKKGGAGRG